MADENRAPPPGFTAFPPASSSTIPLLLTVLPALTLLLTMPFWTGKNKMPVDGRLVVVTGGSQGMGLAVAQQLAAKGADVVIVARDPTKLETALSQITASAKDPSRQKFLYVSADLTNPTEVERAFREIVAWGGGPPDITWICAGGAQPMLLTECPPTVLESQMKTNYMSAVYTAQAVLKHLIPTPPKSPSHMRHIIFTSSIAAFYPIVGYAPYAPAKAALRNLADGLRQECLLYDNIDVHCCFPGTIFSPGYEQEQLVKHAITKKIEETDGGQTPEEVARICINRLEKGDGLVVTTWIGESLRGISWGGSQRNFWLWDFLVGWVIGLVWPLIGGGIDRDVKEWRRKNGPVKVGAGLK